MYKNADSLPDTPKIPSTQLFSIKGQHALITGGSRGIGQAIALALSQAGAHVIIAQRDLKNTQTQKLIQEDGGKCDLVKLDLTDMEDCQKVFDRALKIVPSIEILINCAGMLHGSDAADYLFADWQQVMNVNLNSVFLICQSAGRHMIPRKYGKIINISSIIAFVGGDGASAYATSKAAVANLTKALSNEWSKHGVSVNAIAPGTVVTDMTTEVLANPEKFKTLLTNTPAGRYGNPDDFAGPALFLASPASNWVTGEILVVDGGAMAKGPL